MTPIARETTVGSAATHRADTVNTAAAFILEAPTPGRPANDTDPEGSSRRSILTARGKRTARRQGRHG